ncbi:MAG: hypothetical protein ACJAZO_001721 [Myxococcota bacterium]|jgi:hypothetical protein
MMACRSSSNSRRPSSAMGLEVIGILCGGIGITVVAGVIAIVVFGGLRRR